MPSIAPDPGYVPPPPPPVLQATEVALNPAAPLSPVQPSANPIVNAGLGLGPAGAVNVGAALLGHGELDLIAPCIGVAIQWLKNRKHFREATWTVPVLFAICFALAVGLWVLVPYLITGAIDAVSVHTAVTKGSGLVTLSHSNYALTQVSGIGIFNPTKPENRWEGKS